MLHGADQRLAISTIDHCLCLHSISHFRHSQHTRITLWHSSPSHLACSGSSAQSADLLYHHCQCPSLHETWGKPPLPTRLLLPCQFSHSLLPQWRSRPTYPAGSYLISPICKHIHHWVQDHNPSPPSWWTHSIHTQQPPLHTWPLLFPFISTPKFPSMTNTDTDHHNANRCWSPPLDPAHLLLAHTACTNCPQGASGQAIPQGSAPQYGLGLEESNHWGDCLGDNSQGSHMECPIQRTGESKAKWREGNESVCCHLQWQGQGGRDRVCIVGRDCIWFQELDRAMQVVYLSSDVGIDRIVLTVASTQMWTPVLHTWHLWLLQGSVACPTEHVHLSMSHLRLEVKYLLMVPSACVNYHGEERPHPECCAGRRDTIFERFSCLLALMHALESKVSHASVWG